MNFNISEITENDVPEIFNWFSGRKWPLPAVHGVGPKIGVIAKKNGISYACIYSYITGTSVAYLEWPCTNPNVSQDQSMEAFDEIVFHFKKMCELSAPKIRVMVLMTQSESLANRFKKHGFKVQPDYYRAIWTLKE